MVLDVRRGLVVFACVSVGFGISAGPGLVARAAEPARWVGAITTDARTSVAREVAQHRIAELERRVKELEAERSAALQGAEKSPQLATAMAKSEELAARNLALSLENQELVHSRASQQSALGAAACEPPNDADAKAQVRYWAKLIRDDETAVHRLSPAWNHALNVVLRRERELDPNNPWR